MGGRLYWRAVPSDPIARAVALHADAARLREAGEHRRALAAARRALALFERHAGRRRPRPSGAPVYVAQVPKMGRGR